MLAVLLAAQSAALAADQRPIVGAYEGGTLAAFEVAGRRGFVIEPTGSVDPARRWIWVAPFWLAIGEPNKIEHKMYVERFLAAGFHVVGVDVGTSCGSPAGADVYQQAYEYLRRERKLNDKARLLGQSNGGLISYAWAFRHPRSLDRIGCIYPATDFRSWPGLPKVLTYPEAELAYGLTLDELTRRAAEFNPIDNLEPLAKAGVKIFHIHGDKDELVPADVNTVELVKRYRKLDGKASWEPLPGLGHGNPRFYQSESLVEFLIE
jgi:pimeloyl-ACP methyl ester carboxylesterase